MNEHCRECGAYLANIVDQETHADWHADLDTTLNNLHTAILGALNAVEREAMWHRPIGDNP